MSFSEIGDNELLYLIRCNNNEAKQYLIERYRVRIYGMIKSFVLKRKLKIVNFDDYFQWCFITFLKCLKLCDEEYNFRNYVKTAVENILNRIFEQEESYDEILSLEDQVFDRDVYSLDVACDSSSIYFTSEIKKYLDENLSLLDRKIVDLKIKGYKSVEIAKILEINNKEIYKRIANIRKIIDLKFK